MIRRRKRRRRTLSIITEPFPFSYGDRYCGTPGEKPGESALRGQMASGSRTDGDSQIVPSADKLGKRRIRRNTALPAVHVGENTYLVNIAIPPFSPTIDLAICGRLAIRLILAYRRVPRRVLSYRFRVAPCRPLFCNEIFDAEFRG